MNNNSLNDILKSVVLDIDSLNDFSNKVVELYKIVKILKGKNKCDRCAYSNLFMKKVLELDLLIESLNKKISSLSLEEMYVIRQKLLRKIKKYKEMDTIKYIDLKKYINELSDDDIKMLMSNLLIIPINDEALSSFNSQLLSLSREQFYNLNCLEVDKDFKNIDKEKYIKSLRTVLDIELFGIQSEYFNNSLNNINDVAELFSKTIQNRSCKSKVYAYNCPKKNV